MTNEELVARFKAGNESALPELINQNKGLIVLFITRKGMLGGNLNDDAIQAANIAVWEAARTYNPRKKTKFTTHLGWQIRKHLMELERSYLPKGDKGHSGRKYNIVPIDDRAMNVGCQFDLGKLEDKLELETLLRKLNARERDYITRFFGIGCDSQTLREISTSAGLSHQRVNQIIVAGLNKMRGSRVPVHFRFRKPKTRRHDPGTIPPGQKYCYGCRTEKPLGDFDRDKSRYDRLGNLCRECKSAKDRAAHAANPEPKRQQAREFKRKKRLLQKTA